MTTTPSSAGRTANAESLKRTLGRLLRTREPDRQLDYALFCAFAEPNEANPWDPNFENHFTRTPAMRNCAAIALQALIARTETDGGRDGG